MESALNPSTNPLVVSIKANLFAYYACLGRSLRAWWRDDPELTWLLTGIPHPFLNNILRAQLTSSNVEARINETLEYFHSRGIPEFSWWVEPDSRPLDLNKRLVSHGLIFTDEEPGMACELSKLNQVGSTSPAYKIECVQDSAMLRQWVQVAIGGFGLPATCSDTCFNLFAGLGFDLPLRNYVGFLNGVPVACSQLFLGAGVAGIYWVATLPEVRQQGLGSAITLTPLLEARDMGFTHAILHSSEMGFAVYQRIGFRELCKMDHFMATADSK